MSRRKNKPTVQEDLKSKGILFLIGGVLLFFLPLPVFGHALRSFSWVLILLGVVLLAIPTLANQIKKKFNELESSPNSEPANPFTGGAASSKKRGTTYQRSTVESEAAQRVEPVLDAHSRQSKWSAQVFRDLEWRRFEAVCELLFCQAGFTAKTQSHGADGGVDIWLFSANAIGPAAIVQCKHWRNKPVGVKELREFFGVMASNKVSRGTYATSSTFTQDALGFAQKNGINAMDGERMLLQISRRSPEQQLALLDTAYEGEYWRPTCASCGVKMVDGKPTSQFWGCSNFPKCRNKLRKASDAT